ncbi:MAG: copper transport protein [Acidimicrobiaceae bacterium]
MRRALVAIALVAGAVFALASPASAHAVLETTSPADRAHLDAVPPIVTLQFSENVSAELGAVKVFDGAGKRVDNGNLEARNNAVSLGLQSGLGDGAYIVTWRVISADSHPVRGAFTFTVGAGAEATDSAVANVLDSGGDRVYEIAGAVARLLAYGGILLASGGGLFLVLAHDGGEERARLVRVVTLAAITGTVGVLLEIPAQAALVTGLGLEAVTNADVVRDVLGRGVGWSSLLSIAGVVAVVIGVRRPPSGRTRSLVLGGAAIATAAFALAGHTRTTSPGWLAMTTDITHVWAAAAWFGGIVLLVLALRARRAADADKDNAIATGRVVARFSRIATLAVIVVSVAGLTLAWTEVRVVKALTSTTYGWLIVAKVLAVAVIAAFGAYNHFRLVPALEQAPKKAGMALRRTVKLEALVMVGVLAITAVLVNTTPARDAAGLSGIFSATVAMGDGSANLVVDPDRAGQNSVHLYLLDAAGRNRDVQSLTLEFSLPANDVGPIARDAYLAGQGHYQVDGGDLSIPGTWTITVKARVDKFTAESADVQVTVHP